MTEVKKPKGNLKKDSQLMDLANKFLNGSKNESDRIEVLKQIDSLIYDGDDFEDIRDVAQIDL